MEEKQKHVKKERLSESVKEQLRNKIRNGEWKAGEKLPAERVLSEVFGVSRTVIRETVRDLAQEQVLELRDGGTFVRPLSFEEMIGNLAQMAEPSESLAQELLEVRRVLANEIVKQAARNWNGTKEEPIRACIAVMEERILQGEVLVQEDWQFMELLSQAAGSQTLGSLYHMCRVIVARSIVQPMRNSKKRSVGMETVQNYKNILNAVKNQDSIEAVRLMNNHEQFINKILTHCF